MKTRDYLDIDRIAFIGRTYDEYIRMFALNGSDLKKGPVLDCPGGPSSFTAEGHKLNLDVAACDIMYALPVDKLIRKGDEDIAHVFEKFDEVSHLYTWEYYSDKETVISMRNKALKLFADDFMNGKEHGRYVYAELPWLPFPDNSFSLVLSSHFLFLYNDRLDLEFHKACLKELARVSYGEVRIFPVTGLDTKLYPHMEELCEYLKTLAIEAELVQVPFEFQRGANKMLRLRCNETTTGGTK